jgi:hypothetical protein
LISLASFLPTEWLSSFFLFLPLILLHNITTILVFARLDKIPKWHLIKQAEKDVPAFIGIYLVMSLLIHLYILDLVSIDIFQRKAFEVLLIIVVLNPDILSNWIPLYHSNPTKQAIMACLGSAIIWLAYPALAETGFIGPALVYLLAGLAMYVLLRKLVEKKPKSAMKSAGRRKKGNVFFTIEESGSYYRDPMYANERKEEKNRREAIRIGHRTMELESSEEEEEMDEYVTYPKELIREGIEFLDDIGQVPDALYRPLSGKHNFFNFVMFWLALLQ